MIVFFVGGLKNALVVGPSLQLRNLGPFCLNGTL